MFDALRARFRRTSTDHTTDEERQAKRAARAVARQKAQAQYRLAKAKGQTEGGHGHEPFI